MKQDWILYYNPRCGTCQKVLKALNDRGITPTIVEYLKNPPTVETLESLLRIMKATPLQIMREKEPIFEELKLGNGSHSNQDLLKAISKHPELLQRPIVVKGNQAAIVARPPEKLMELF